MSGAVTNATSSTSSSVSTSLTTSSTVAPTSSASTSSSSTVVTSSIYVTPSTTYVAPSTTSTSVEQVTSTVTRTPTNGGTGSPSVVIVTSTVPLSNTSATSSSSSSTSSASASPSALSASGSVSSGSGGLTTGAKIAIAVIIPIVVLAAAFFLGLFLWRKRKARKDAEELRKNEMAEYGFNPNQDQTLAPVAAAAAYADDGSEAPEDNSGYRGWGATSSNRKASTTLGSNNRPVGLAVSDGGSQPGGYHYQSSPNEVGQGSEHYSADPLVNGHPEGIDGVGTLGAAAGAGAVAGGVARHRSQNNDIRRGASNASSAYSNGRALSEASSDSPPAVPGPYYHEEVPYNIYNDAQPNLGPYGDGTYGGQGGQPVIRDVQARRNTRIERAPTFPQTQGGIAQNF